MDNTTLIALLVGAALVLYLVLTPGRGAPPEGRRVASIVGVETDPIGFISPSGGDSVDFVPIEDDNVRYSDYSS